MNNLIEKFDVLGIDPGIARLGWCILKCEYDKVRKNGQIDFLDGGCFETKATEDKKERICRIYSHLNNKMNKYNVMYIGIEQVFFSKNVKTALLTSECRGIIYLLAGLNKIQMLEFKPNEIKLSVTGYGSANKSQVQSMIMNILNLDFVPQPDDFADAISVAYCTAEKVLFNMKFLDDRSD